MEKPWILPDLQVNNSPFQRRHTPHCTAIWNGCPSSSLSDGSGFKGSIGTSAILYIKDWPLKTLCYYLGTENKHPVYKAEGVDLVMGLHLLKNLNIKLIHTALLGADSQAVLRALNNQCLHPGQYILDSIHNAAESLHRKQDRLINHAEQDKAITSSDGWKGRPRGVIDLHVHWVRGHINFVPNEMADKKAKKAVQEDSSNAKSLPKLLYKCLPLSISALQQSHSSRIKKHWEHRWKFSPRKDLLKTIDNLPLRRNTYN